jgi:hypothetical protein
VDGVWWAAVTPGVVRIAPVPDATPTREVFVLPRGQGGTWIRVSATVNGRTYADSVYVVAAGALPYALAMDAMRVLRPGRTFIITAEPRESGLGYAAAGGSSTISSQ